MSSHFVAYEIGPSYRNSMNLVMNDSIHTWVSLERRPVVISDGMYQID